MQEELVYRLLSGKARPPVKASREAAGFDLSSAVDCVIPSGTRALVSTDLSITVPEGTYGRLASRSGLALNHCIDVAAGVVDRDFRGNVGVVLVNSSPQPFVVRAGDRVAQLVCERVSYPALVEAGTASAAVVPTGERNDSGFGSTGICRES